MTWPKVAYVLFMAGVAGCFQWLWPIPPWMFVPMWAAFVGWRLMHWWGEPPRAKETR